jgi:hypothetical protein
MKGLDMSFKDCTSEQFYDHLIEAMGNYSSGELLAIPGVYEVLSEHLNNDALELWAMANGRDPETGEPIADDA